MKKKHFILLSFYLLSLNIIAQESNLTILGHVINENSHPIENAHIFYKEDIGGAISTSNGFFQIRVPKNTNALIISHVSYKEQKVHLANRIVFGDSIYLEIVLEMNPNYLSSIDIVESKRWQVVKPDRVWVYDYELIGKDEMLLLLKDTAKYELRYLSADKLIVDNLTLNKNSFCKLLEDGLGNTHLALNDSLRQIYTDGNQLSFYSALHKREYSTIILPIVAHTGNLFIFEELSLNNQKLNYYSINKKTKDRKLIAEIYHQERYRNSVEVKKQQMSYPTINYVGELTIDDLRKLRLYFQWGQYFDKVTIKPFYSPLVKFGESFCVFDLLNGFMSLFNAKGELINEQIITFHLNKKVYSIEVDKGTGDFYSLWKKNGIVHIDKINMQQGSVEKTYILKDYIFPEKVQFRNGNIYFLYSDYNFNKKLFKMPISHL